jgi:hypothetical protein
MFSTELIMLNAPWIGKVVAGATLAAIFALLWISRKLEKRGVFKNYSRGLGRGLLEVETMLRPSRQYVRNAKEDKKALDDDQGGPGPEPR